MCTAISFNGNGYCFGRNLDLCGSYGEKVTVMPRKYPFLFRKTEVLSTGYAVIGMAKVVGKSGEKTPLFYDGMNEYGLAVAGLNFPGNAYYLPPDCPCKRNYAVAPFELIPWVLRKCKTVNEAKKLMHETAIVDLPYSESMPNTPLHWMISDRSEDAVIEQTREGLLVIGDSVGVLTNNPPFKYQLDDLEKYRSLETDNGNVQIFEQTEYSSSSYGLGALGLPGDVSSQSRFVRACFVRKNSVCAEGVSDVEQLFHILSAVAVTKGTCKNGDGKDHYTVYTSCLSEGRYYYTTYGNRQISCVDMNKTDLDGKEICSFSLLKEQNVFYQN